MIEKTATVGAPSRNFPKGERQVSTSFDRLGS